MTNNFSSNEIVTHSLSLSYRFIRYSSKICSTVFNNIFLRIFINQYLKNQF